MRRKQHAPLKRRDQCKEMIRLLGCATTIMRKDESIYLAREGSKIQLRLACTLNLNYRVFDSPFFSLLSSNGKARHITLGWSFSCTPTCPTGLLLLENTFPDYRILHCKAGIELSKGDIHTQCLNWSLN